MPETILLSVVSVALLALAVVSTLALSGKKEPKLTGPTPEDYAELVWNLGKQEQRITDLYLAVDEGIRRVDRAEARVKKTVTSSRRLLAESGLEHPGLEAEHAELQSGDEPPSQGFHVLDVPETVVDTRPTGFPGVTRADLQALNEAVRSG